LYPPPCFVDTTFKLSNINVSLFGNSKEEALYSLQFFSTFLSEYTRMGLGYSSDLLISDAANTDHLKPTELYTNLHKKATHLFAEGFAKTIKLEIKPTDRYHDLKVR
jgi:hypothetical protein